MLIHVSSHGALIFINILNLLSPWTININPLLRHSTLHNNLLLLALPSSKGSPAPYLVAVKWPIPVAKAP